MVWGDELSRATGDARYANLIMDAANRFQPAAPGEAPPPCDPDFRTEDMFMAGALLGRAFQITGEGRYVDLLTTFLLDGNIQQENGLFWHCRSAPYYWGRGNGFAAMGLTETLTYLPQDHGSRPAIMAMYLRLVESLRRLQRPSGMLPQVLDFPGSYDEFTAACMMGYCPGARAAPRLAPRRLPRRGGTGLARSSRAHRRRGQRGGRLRQHRRPAERPRLP